MHLQYWPIKILRVHRVRWQSFAIWMHSWIVWLYSQLCGGFWTIFSSCLVYWLAWKEIILRDLRRILCHNSCIWACFGQFFFCVCALVCQLAWKKISAIKCWGDWEHSGRFLHRHAERVEVRGMRKFWFMPICLYREAVHLQCPRAHKRDDLYPIWSQL